MPSPKKIPRTPVQNLPQAMLPVSEDAVPFNFKENANWRIFRILAEFVEGFEFLSPLKKEVTFFGSARFDSANRHYQDALELAKMLGKAGFTVVTGGGPGIMQAANQGAFETGAPSVGLNIQLPMEQRTNPYVKQSMGFHYFFTRKVMLSASAQAYIYFPGGYGTLDEFFEIVTLVQTKKMEPMPIVLMGKDYWGPLAQWLKAVVYEEHGCIHKEDLDLFHVVDTPKKAFEIIRKSKERVYF